MDQTQFAANDAVAQPVVADSAQGIPAESQVTGGVSGESPTPPDAAAASATPQTQAPPADAVDYRAIVEQMAPRYQQYEQAFTELRGMMAQAEQQRQEQEARTAAQQRIDRAYQLAETMPPEDGYRHIRQSEDMERANLLNQINAIRQQAQQQTWQVASVFAAPLYADELGRQHNLPPDMIQRLKMIGDPRQMDSYVPAMKAELAQRHQQDAKYQSLLTQLDQLQRTQQANAAQATGAHTVGNGGAPVIGNLPGGVPPGGFQAGDAGGRELLLSKLPPGFFGGGGQ